MTFLEPNSFEEITSIKALRQGFDNAIKGKQQSIHATELNYKLIPQLTTLQKELRNRTYKPRPYRIKIILEPKVRKIEAPAFRDRIVHHAVHSTLNPFYEKHFINDSYACRSNRGTHRAVKRVEQFIHKNPNLYVCKIDVSKYFTSINHRKLYEILNKRIKDKQLLYLLAQIIHSTNSGTEYDYLFPSDSYFHTKGARGIPIGNLTSQLFANIYLHELDMYAKQTLKIRQYVRYMDDILIFHEDKKELERLQQKIIEFLYNELYLTVNPRKVRLFPARVGVDFVGFIIWPYKRRVRGSSVRRFRRRFNKQLHRLQNEPLSKREVEKIISSFEAWKAHAAHSKNPQFIINDHQRLIKAIKLWKARIFYEELLQKRTLGLVDENFNPIPKKPIQLSLFDLLD